MVVSLLREIQYHVIVYSPDANGGPGLPKLELTPDVLNLTWQQALNGAGQAAWSMVRFNPKLSSIDYMKDHVKIIRRCKHADRVVFSGKIVRPDEGSRDTILYAWDYAAFLQRSRTGYKTLYPNKKIGTEIVAPEWNLAKTVDTSPFAFVATGTIEDPLADDETTPITVNDQFGVVDFDRLFTFYALAEMSMANTDHTVVFEITREAPHTFNFWKNKGSVKTNYHFSYPGNLLDYEMDTGHDQIQNDIATVINDPATGSQSEYVLSSCGSIADYRRLQSAVAIKTLYGISTGTTVTDQQKAAAARILATSVQTPKVLTLYPRQHEIDPFYSWDLGDKFTTTLREHDRSGDYLDVDLRVIALACAWTPDAGELLQVHVR